MIYDYWRSDAVGSRKHLIHVAVVYEIRVAELEAWANPAAPAKGRFWVLTRYDRGMLSAG